VHLGTAFALIPCVAEPSDKALHLERDADRTASPRNLIYETSRFDEPDPPNLHRLSTRQVIEERGIVEIHDRFVDGGIVARIVPDERKRRR